MSLLSAPFLTAFVPCALLCAFIGSARVRAVILVCASLAMIGLQNIVYLPCFVAWCALTYALSRAGLKRTAAGLQIILLVVSRFIPALSALGVPYITLSLFTFALYGQKEASARAFALYAAFYPKIPAGPIASYAQFSAERPTLERCARGMERMIVGLSKKVLLADTLAPFVDAVFACGARHPVFAWLGALAFMAQLYFDFSGCVDIALGVSEMAGVTLPENFDKPFAALGMRDFWRRWHITLQSWMKQYVYIPLGGSRKGKARMTMAVIAVFLCTALWHGAKWTYLLWGLGNAALVLAERFWGARPERWPKPFARGCTLLCASLLFVMFRASTPAQAFAYYETLFAGGGLTALLPQLSPAVVLALLCGAALPFLHARALMLPRSVRYVLLLPLLALCVMTLASRGFSPALYAAF